MPALKRIGVLTGGGDCPGLNAAIRAVAKAAMYQHGLEVFGIEDGFLGLVENRVRPLSPADVSNIINTGGTILGTSNRCDVARYIANAQTPPRDVRPQCMATLRQHGLDALVVIGGDGTMAAAAHFVHAGVNVVGVPKTIDNDLVGSDVTIGFATAVYVASAALDRIHTTAASHHRAMVVEIMGRNAGWLALHSGVASGADVILIPEIAYDIDKVCDAVRDRSRHSKRYTLIAVSEGARPVGGAVTARIDPNYPDPVRLGGVGQVLADDIEKRTGLEARCTVLGHVQRGGTPLPSDRVLATDLGHAAVRLLVSGATARLVTLRHGAVTDLPLLESAGKQRVIQPATDGLVAAARSVGTHFGD